MAAPSLASTVLGAPDPVALADFYRNLLGWEVDQFDPPTWVKLLPPDGGSGLSFQLEEEHVPPAWPAGAGQQQMQLHLDIRVPDLEEGVRRAEGLGATLAAHQPQDDVRVMSDPAGHPFCLFSEA